MPRIAYALFRTAGRLGLRGLVPALALAALTGCGALDSALRVEATSRIPAAQLMSPGNAVLLVNGAIGDFECAAGAYDALTSVVAGEMTDATQTADRWPYDKRDVHSSDARYAVDACEALGVYAPLSTARFSADTILVNLQQWTDAQVPNRQDLIAQAAAYAGYSYLLLGEGFCSMAIAGGKEQTPQQIFAIAQQRFTTALAAAQAAGDNDILNMAYVGRARTRLDLGDTQGAASDAAQVPPGYVHAITANSSPSRRNNRIYAQSGVGSTGGDALSVGESYRDVTFQGVPDPRVKVDSTGKVATEGTPIFLQEKFNSLSDPIPLATGIEAQLILAEVKGGQTAVDIINALHDRVGLPHFSSTDPAAIQAQVIEERRRELWLQGNRFYDINRLKLPLNPPPGTAYRKGGTYGSTVCLPLPDVERQNNPNIGG